MIAHKFNVAPHRCIQHAALTGDAGGGSSLTKGVSQGVSQGAYNVRVGMRPSECRLKNSWLFT